MTVKTADQLWVYATKTNLMNQKLLYMTFLLIKEKKKILWFNFLITPYLHFQTSSLCQIIIFINFTGQILDMTFTPITETIAPFKSMIGESLTVENHAKISTFDKRERTNKMTINFFYCIQ